MSNFINKSILIAEVDDCCFWLMEEYLLSTGIKIVHAYNGNEIIDILETLSFDLILMDINIPKMSGFETILKIRETNNKIPILANTAVHVEIVILIFSYNVVVMIVL